MSPLAEVLDGLPVTRSDLRPDALLPIGVISTILDRAAALPGLADIGLVLSRSTRTTWRSGPVGQLMMSCQTLGSALGTFVAVQMANSSAAAAYLHPLGEDYAIGFGVYAPELPSNHIYDISAAMGFNMVRDLTGGAVRPVEVLLSRPVPADPDAYRGYFRCPVRFNEGQTCLILPGRGMGFRLPTADAELRESLLAALQKQTGAAAAGSRDRVRHALRPLMLAGNTSQSQVAAHLNLHPRTLGRRLEAEGVTFEHLKDEVRLAVSRELLARTDIAVSDIAAALGYATPSAFVRAFRRWTGVRPRLAPADAHVRRAGQYRVLMAAVPKRQPLW